jgi:hypothetical protein
MKWHNGDFKRPAAAEHNEHETDLDFDSNVLETQLGGVSNSLQHEKVINTPEFPVVVQTLSPHNPTQLAKVEQSFEKASRSGKSVSFRVLYRADSQLIVLIVCLKQWQ